MLSVGMSNTTQEYSTFIPLANASGLKIPRVLLVDGAQGGQTAAVFADPNANAWAVIESRLRAMRVGVELVTVDGRIVRRLPPAPHAPGPNTLGWPNLANDSGHALPRGVYFLRMRDEAARVQGARGFVLAP